MVPAACSLPCRRSTTWIRPDAAQVDPIKNELVFMNVVIVELAAKAKTINKYLGPSFKVLASYGHVSDLPPKDGSVLPDNDFEMKWEEDGQSAKVMKRDRRRGSRRRQGHSRHRPRSRGRGDLLAYPAPAGEEEGPEEGHARRARRLQRRHQAGDPGGAGQSAPDRRAAGRGLPRPPRARLSRRLHAVAGAVAQAAGSAIGRPRAVRRAAPRLRPRGGDRGVQDRRVLDDRGAALDAEGRGRSRRD